jgi:hypothetical protein
MWTNEHMHIILDYYLNRISREEVFERLPFDTYQVFNEIRQQLTVALESKDGDLIETTLLVAGLFDIPEDHYIDMLWLLVAEDWHRKHEDIIGTLQDHADPRSIPCIKQAIDLKPRLEYLAYDDYGSYYKKCLWALQDIGTPEAIAVIQDCTESQDSALREEAFYRLSKIKTSS